MSGARAATRPILPSADLEATSAFYAPLGFEQQGLWAQEYLILRGPDGIELHFWFCPTVDRWTNDVACFVAYDDPADVRALYDRWSSGDAVPAPAQLNAPTAGGHLVEFALIDLHGNLVRVGAPI